MAGVLDFKFMAAARRPQLRYCVPDSVDVVETRQYSEGIVRRL